MNGVVYKKLEWLIGSWISAAEEVALLPEAAEVMDAAAEAVVMLDEVVSKRVYQLSDFKILKRLAVI
jgi:hypothetical protein